MLQQGWKQAYLGGTTHIYDRDQYFCITLPLSTSSKYSVYSVMPDSIVETVNYGF
ncbi:hypothetical protein [Acaryochloris marina]|uniref:hypothetical protein n=1 Tax=Acaryochloris marina TaxID=155978 RepID=UPI0036F30DD2